VPRSGPRYSEAQAREALAASRTYSEALRRLGMRPAGGNHATIRRYAEEIWKIPVDHLDPDSARRGWRHPPTPLADVLVEQSTYNRGRLKDRLFEEGLKERACELCGQGEVWQDRPMSLILDHINGVADDNRLENLRVVCPNCNATLDTHCGKKNRRPREARACGHCGRPFMPRTERTRYCGRECGQRAPKSGPRPGTRRAERPPYEQLLDEIDTLGYLAVGRKYGVSDDAIRKWRLAYEAERGATAEAPATGGSDRDLSITPSASGNAQSPAPGTPATATAV
jgi:hypothetical protein